MIRKRKKFLFFILLFVSVRMFANPGPDSLLNALPAATGEVRVKILNDLRKYYKNRDPGRALIYARQALAEAEKTGNSKLIATVLNDMGIVYLMMQKNDSAEMQLSRSLSLYKKIGDSAGIAKTTNNLGIAYNQFGRYSLSLDYYLQAINYYEKQPDKSFLAKVYLSLALVLEQLKRYQDAISYLSIARTIGSTTADQKLVADASLNLGLVYKSMEKKDSSQYHLLEALKFYKTAGGPYDLAISYTNLAQLYHSDKQYETAGKYFHLALPLTIKLGNKWAETGIYNGLGEMYLDMNKQDSARYYLYKAVDNLKQCPDINQSSITHKLLYSLFRKEGNFREALLHHELYKLYDDSAAQQNNFRALEEKISEYHVRQREAEYNILLKDNKLHKLRQWILAGSVALILLVSLYIILLLNNRKRNLLLVNKSSLADNQRLELENQLRSVELKELTQEKEMKEEEMRKLHMELQLKEQDLVFQTLTKLDRDMLYKSVFSKMSPFQYLFSRKKDQEDFLKALKSINMDTHRDPLADFELTFTNLHRGFYERLLQTFPALTKQELTICALIRLNLNSKDISNLLNISLSTVDVTRHHIRKKMNLDQKESLTAALIMV